MFESRISARAMEKLSVSEKSDANISSLSHDMEGHANKCVERLRTGEEKQLNSYTKSQHHALTTTSSKKKTWDLLENCEKYSLICS